MDGKTLARLGAVIFVAVAITATVIEINRPADPPTGATVRDLPPMTRDPLDAELARCGGIGEAGERDPSCLKAWADNRRRFLGQPAPAASSAPPAPSNAPAPSSAPATLFPSETPSTDPAKPAMQSEPARPEAR